MSKRVAWAMKTTLTLSPSQRDLLIGILTRSNDEYEAEWWGTEERYLAMREILARLIRSRQLEKAKLAGRR